MKVIDRESFILENRGLVLKIANKYRWAIGKSIEFDDLVQIGFEGLIKAVDRNDPTKGFKFSTFAYKLIEGGIKNFLRDKHRLIRVPANLQYLITRIIMQDVAHLTPIELADRFDCTESMAERAKLIIERGDATSLDKTIFEDNEQKTLADLVECEQDFTNIFVDDFLETLTERQKQFVLERLKGKTEREIGKELGFSRSWAFELRKQAGVKLKGYMEVN